MVGQWQAPFGRGQFGGRDEQLRQAVRWRRATVPPGRDRGGLAAELQQWRINYSSAE